MRGKELARVLRVKFIKGAGSTKLNEIWADSYYGRKEEIIRIQRVKGRVG